MTTLDPEAVVDRIAETEALDRVAGPLAGWVGRLLPPGPVKDALSGTPLRHPLHPALVPVPIGLLLGANVLDLLGGRGARTASRRLIGVGVLSALPAIATGWSDWSDTIAEEARVGLVHAVSNATAVSLYAGSWAARRRGRHLRGRLLALGGAAGLVAGGWLGGHLAYAYGVGVDTTAFQEDPADWTDVAAADAIVEGQLTGVSCNGVPVLLVRRAGRLHALADRCTHRGGPLSEGSLEGDCVPCPWHASRFRLSDGHVRRGPATRPQPSYELREEAGRVQIRARSH